MAGVLEQRMRHPTGLLRAEVRSLHQSERLLLGRWMAKVSGDDDGRPWVPGAIRALSLEERLALASIPELHHAFVERERRRVRASVHYFIPAYGHVKPDDPEPDEIAVPIPFALWPEQRDVLQTLIDEPLVAVLKARQLGLTWLALHYGFHLQALDPRTPDATILGLSQDGGYAKRLLGRARRINELLPPYLRLEEERETEDSKSEFKLAGRGRMISLAGTKDAPRSWQADFAICDEWAFVRNGQAGPTMRALLPAARKIAAISSGNGPPDEPGKRTASGERRVPNGQHFAQLWTRADAGQSDWVSIFLPTSTHPERDAHWRDEEQANYDTDEEFLAEHPETPDEALVGAGKDRYFKLGDIAAAVRLGAELDALLGTDEMPDPSGGTIHPGLDWGENMHGLVIWPLEGGGVYIPPCEVVQVKTEPGEAAVAFHDAVLEEIQEVDPETGELAPALEEARFDSAGIQSMRTFLATARERFTRQYLHGEVRSWGCKFNRSKTATAKYMRRLFKRTGQGRSTQVIAISPANPELIRQLRALESGAGGVWKKAEDQHGPDAAVAGIAPIARRHRALRDD